MNKKLSHYIEKIKDSFAQDTDINKEFIFFLKEKLKITDLDILSKNFEITNYQIDLIHKFIDDKKKGIPIDYILESSFFNGRKFIVDNQVLIPRPETKLLVDYINNLYLKKNAKILDAGSGSGCIGISLALDNSKILVYANDISFQSCEISKANKLMHEVKNYYLINSNWLSCYQENIFDLIVSNPPYIRKNDVHLKELMHEPKIALIAEEKGLRNFRLITEQAYSKLKKDGILIFEHGYNQSKDVKLILKENGLHSIKTIKDYNLNFRVTFGRK